MSNEETKEAKKELDEIDKKFDEARGVKFKVNYRVVRFYDHGDLSSKNSLTMQICPMKKLLQMMKQVKMIKLPLLKLRSMRISLLGYRFLSDICCLYCPVCTLRIGKMKKWLKIMIPLIMLKFVGLRSKSRSLGI